MCLLLRNAALSNSFMAKLGQYRHLFNEFPTCENGERVRVVPVWEKLFFINRSRKIQRKRTRRALLQSRVLAAARGDYPTWR